MGELENYSLQDVISIGCNERHAFVLYSDGSLDVFPGSEYASEITKNLNTVDDTSEISVGYAHVCALSGTGTVSCYGAYSYDEVP